MNRESFVFYKSFFDCLIGMDSAMQGKCLMALADYALNGVVPCAEPEVMMFFTLTRPQIDANNKRYNNGCKGGRKTNQTETKNKPNDNQTETKVEPNDNVNDNVNVRKENNIKEKIIQLSDSLKTENKNSVVISSEFKASDYEQLMPYVRQMPDDVIKSVEGWIVKTKLGKRVDMNFIAKQFTNFATRQGKPFFKEGV